MSKMKMTVQKLKLCENRCIVNIFCVFTKWLCYNITQHYITCYSCSIRCYLNALRKKKLFILDVIPKISSSGVTETLEFLFLFRTRNISMF